MTTSTKLAKAKLLELDRDFKNVINDDEIPHKLTRNLNYPIF